MERHGLARTCYRTPSIPAWSCFHLQHQLQLERQHRPFASKRRGLVVTGVAAPPKPPGAPRVRRRPQPIIDPNVRTARSKDNSNMINLRDLTRNDGGPPRFNSPFVAERDPAVRPSELPLMVYLPGIDGTGLAASRQYPLLVNHFDLRAFFIPSHDRTPFMGLIDFIEKYLEEEVQASCPPERPVYVLGESFGGVLAVMLAARRPDLVDRLVLVNPATSFNRSLWPTVGTVLPQVPKEFYGALPVALAPALGNPLALAAYGLDPDLSLPEQLRGVGEGLLELVPQLMALADILPADTLNWKLQLLTDGCQQAESQIRRVQQRTLLLASDQDLLIPSEQEGRRLADKMPRCSVRVMRGRSHSLLQEAGIDLAAIMMEEGFYVRTRRLSSRLPKRIRGTFGTPNPVELPTLKELERTTDVMTQFIKRATSPVFFSTDAAGIVQQGLGAIPASRPLLFVGNHQTYAIDTGVMVEEFLRQRGILLRGLAHPVVFAGMAVDKSGQPPDAPPANQLASMMSTYGAVPVGGRNFYKLMQAGEAVMLFPGGVREAYKGKGEQYRLFWPRKAEFVRMAARFGATIIPFAGVGSEEGFDIVADGQDILNLPFVGPMLKQRLAELVPSARRGVASDTELDWHFVQPLSLPRVPQRYYFLFRKPIETSPADLEDPSRCQDLYAETRASVEAGIEYLMKERRQDPYREFLPRMLYEASWGGKTAPTFVPRNFSV